MLMWWQEQVISAFHLTRVTVETVGEHQRHLSTVQEVRKVFKLLGESAFILLHYLEIQMQLDMQKLVSGDMM